MGNPSSKSELRRQIAVDASLGALTQRLGVTARALRYYERRGLIAVSRDRLNRRQYDAATQRQIEMIIRLRRCGLGVRAIEEALIAYRRGKPTTAMLLGRLSELLADADRRRRAIRAEIDALRRTAQSAPTQQSLSSAG